MGVNGSPLATQLPPGAGTRPFRSAPIFNLRVLLPGLALLGLAGCASLSGLQGGGAAQSSALPAVARPMDPLAAFAARASLGQQELVGNPPVTARLMRSYNSGAGRPCRELLLGGMNAGRQALYCEESPGQWAAVRALLNNGPGGQP
ncbi:MAG: hypothetical protein JWP20_1181 [Roseomonas sp.]|nr:hypothetical protein [Roseomonas sp.]